MSWVEYFQNATRLVNKKVNSKAMIVNFAPEYFEKLSKLVQEYNKTSEGKTYVKFLINYFSLIKNYKNEFFFLGC